VTEKIVVKNLYKVFGTDPALAMKMLNEGQTKDQIFQKSGMVAGVINANFHVNGVIGFRQVHSNPSAKPPG
jgi:glycine betaine/proline transport system ATP-binding protein